MGDLDQPRKAEFLHTVPASMALLQDLKKTDELVKRLEKRPKATAAPAEPVDMLAGVGTPATVPSRIGEQLGEEVVQMMFDHLAEDRRLLTPLKRQLKAMQGAVHRLAKEDSRFFSDRTHPARQVLDRITQRSLAFQAETDPGFDRFMKSVESASQWLESKVVDADTFRELLGHLQEQWKDQDQGSKQKRAEAAKALLHAEQRNLLAQKLAAEFLSCCKAWTSPISCATSCAMPGPRWWPRRSSVARTARPTRTATARWSTTWCGACRSPRRSAAARAAWCR
nr:DUF1631 family protein [Ramlibacter montanisoli]